jgi:hypothetical protein
MIRLIITIVIVVVVFEVLRNYAPALTKWYGNLPGDISIKTRKGRMNIPIASVIILSLILTVLVNIF